MNKWKKNWMQLTDYYTCILNVCEIFHIYKKNFDFFKILMEIF